MVALVADDARQPSPIRRILKSAMCLVCLVVEQHTLSEQERPSCGPYLPQLGAPKLTRWRSDKTCKWFNEYYEEFRC